MSQANPPSKQDMVTFIKTEEPEAYKLIGNYLSTNMSELDAWAKGLIISRTYDRWFTFFQSEGDSLHLKNVVRNFVNLSSEGFTDGLTNQQRLGNAYRGYIAIAQAVVDAAIAEKSDLMNQLAAETDQDKKTILNVEIANQQSTINAETNNLATWKQTLNDTIAAGRAV